MDTADSSTIHFKSAAGELMCTFAYEVPVPSRLKRSTVRSFCVPKVCMLAK